MSLVLLILGAWEFTKRTQHGKVMAASWIAFAVCFGCVGIGLNVMNSTWHLRNSHKPWKFILVLNGFTAVSALVGIASLCKAIYLRETAESDTDEIGNAEDSKIWPPAPRNL